MDDNDGYRKPLAEEVYDNLQACQEHAELEELEAKVRGSEVDNIIRAQLREAATYSGIRKLEARALRIKKALRNARRRLARRQKQTLREAYLWASLEL